MVNKVRTCKSCNHDNPDNASKCNNCAQSLTGVFSDNYYLRWQCPKCGRLNMDENGKCMCGHKEGCFISTAVCQILGKTDNCEELKLLRNFRDNFLANNPSLQSIVDEYYVISPQIADALRDNPHRYKIAKDILDCHINPILILIKDGRNIEAISSYRTMVDKLQLRL